MLSFLFFLSFFFLFCGQVYKEPDTKYSAADVALVRSLQKMGFQLYFFVSQFIGNDLLRLSTVVFT